MFSNFNAQRQGIMRKLTCTLVALQLGLMGAYVPPVRADAATQQAQGSAATEPASADADRGRAKAKAHFTAASALFETGDYESAQREFQKAYDLCHLPDLLYNLARTANKRGRREEAVGFLRRYLEEKPNADDRAQIEKEIAEIDADRQAEAAKAETARAEVAARQQAEQSRRVPLVTPTPQPLRLPPTPALALGGAGVGLLTIGIGLGIGAMSTARSVESSVRFDPASDQHGRSLDAAGIAFDVIGVLSLAAGAAWTGVWYFRDRKGHEGPQPTGNTARVRE